MHCHLWNDDDDDDDKDDDDDDDDCDDDCDDCGDDDDCSLSSESVCVTIGNWRSIHFAKFTNYC